MSEFLNITEWFSRMPERFQPENAGGVVATYLFDITGERGGKWTVLIEDGSCRVSKGAPEKADVVISTSAPDWIGLVQGTLSGPKAFFSGRLKVKGNLKLASKLKKLFLA